MNKGNRISFYLVITIIALCVLCAVGLGILGVRNLSGRAPKDTDEHVSDKVEESLPKDTSVGGQGSAILEKTTDMGEEYLDKIVFLGDSTTYGLKYYGMLSGGKETTSVWTPKSGTLSLDTNITKKSILYPETGEEINIITAVEQKKPEYLIITLGVNGVSSLGEEEFKTCYRKLILAIKEASPKTKIMLQSIFPVTAAYSDAPNGITNEKINRANEWILSIAKELELRYLDTCSVLKGEDGCLPNSITNDNEMHLNPNGFSIELEYIRTHAYR